MTHLQTFAKSGSFSQSSYTSKHDTIRHDFNTPLLSRNDRFKTSTPFTTSQDSGYHSGMSLPDSPQSPDDTQPCGNDRFTQPNVRDIYLARYDHEDSHRQAGKLGITQLDILSELSFVKQKNFVNIISLIFSYLEAKDLCKICCVSKPWRHICHSDKKHNQRRKDYLAKSVSDATQQGKENTKAVKRAEPRPFTSSTAAFGQIQLEVKTKKPCATEEKKVLDSHKLFREEGTTLQEGEALQKCPKCFSPARVTKALDRGQCQREICNYDFCTKCQCEFHKDKFCKINKGLTYSKIAVGSKKSKRNLKRL